MTAQVVVRRGRSAPEEILAIDAFPKRRFDDAEGRERLVSPSWRDH